MKVEPYSRWEYWLNLFVTFITGLGIFAAWVIVMFVMCLFLGWYWVASEPCGGVIYGK